MCHFYIHGENMAALQACEWHPDTKSSIRSGWPV